MSGTVASCSSGPMLVKDNTVHPSIPPMSPGERIVRSYRRSRSGCYICRLRRKKCDENRPRCSTCSKLDITCEYNEPTWWRNLEQRHIHKERIKRRLRVAKVMEKEKNLQAIEFIDRTLPSSKRRVNVNLPPSRESSYESDAAYMQTPPLPSMSSPFGFDFNGISSWQGPTTSTLTSLGPEQMPMQHPPLSALPQQLPTTQNFHQMSQFAPMLPPFQQTMQSVPQQLHQQIPLDITPHYPQTEVPQQILQQLPLSQQPEPLSQSTDQQYSQQLHQTVVPDISQLLSPTFSEHFASQASQYYTQPPVAQQPQQSIHQASSSYSAFPIDPLLQGNTGDSRASTDTTFPSVALFQGNIPASQTPARAKATHPQHAEIPLSAYFRTTSVNEAERPLLYHFVDNVLPLIFPILDVHPRSRARTREIIRALETNKSYYHCCLSVSAIHVKTVNASISLKADDKVIDDIMRHRYAAVSALHQALKSSNHHDKVLDGTLATILFHCAVGEPDDYLPEIPWYEHFSAAADLVNKLGLIETEPQVSLPFNMSLTTWIDVLGATMIGKSPKFAHTYRSKHLNGVSSGLRELMGCDDRVMYLISEIACLDSLKRERRLDEYSICHHVSALSGQLEYAEGSSPENPISASGVVNPEKLTKNVTAVFRAAARVYLSTLVPGYERTQQSTANLVQAVADLLQFIPDGPWGFDRSIVWPLLIAGVYSTPGSKFRDILAKRSELLGEGAEYGSFGRMYRVLKETWRLSDDTTTQIHTEANYLLPSMNLKQGPDGSSVPPPAIETIGRPIKKQAVHWRDVMKRRNWHYLLL
ncbi:hypothetical protein ASPACDRAFT_1886237 [Aspergillus aculeatus ATCC 16872]|uniref:Zn(2)-C6 fungal-type domain-containing protein n=1 Tax=Aspergillus aculeatus (strain ATCC 16872 / CBS 172.66 / WB 5094) TaxID=690307 RepID=A0A1L9X442_ASPA1|nr:uncharacterized protein ASPACDRAFT_1886237 [Aspergillus aculeatus ATCC 16872]OJK03243.1 hypothetical protein ASPACDRAFT_1886237 [Aspergillus aculeatus ATCC 16872]